MAVLATVVMAEGDIDHPHDRIEEKKNQSQEEVKKNIELMEAELADMKAKLVTKKTEKSIMDRIHFKGDLRVRYESKEYDYSDGSEKNQYLGRYRLRLGAVADLTEDLHFEFGMRSGYANPTSGNQTFVEANKDTQGLARYFWQSLRVNVLGLSYNSGNSTYKVGRQPYMMYRPIKSQLVWDNDISLDGINYQYKDDANIFTAGVNRTSWAEASVSQNDVDLYLAQYVRTTKFENSKLNLGAGFYYYEGVKGNTSLYSSNKGSSMGNTMINPTTGLQEKDDKNGAVFANDYHIAEGFGELKFKNVLGKPLTVAAGVAYNTAASNNNFGYDLAFQVGKAKEVGDWQLKYSYTELQEDAVLGAHSDSDNFGGGTAAKGHAIRPKYKFDKNTYLAATFFYNTRYASKDAKAGDTDYERVQLDVILKF